MDNPGELVRKLGIKPGAIVVVLGAPPEALRQLRPVMPEGASLAEAEVGAPDIVLVWLLGTDDLDATLAHLRGLIKEDGSVWAVLPRQARRGPPAQVTFDRVQAAALKVGFVDNKMARFSDAEYGIRFVVRKELRTGPRSRGSARL